MRARRRNDAATGATLRRSPLLRLLNNVPRKREALRCLQRSSSQKKSGPPPLDGSGRGASLCRSTEAECQHRNKANQPAQASGCSLELASLGVDQLAWLAVFQLRSLFTRSLRHSNDWQEG